MLLCFIAPLSHEGIVRIVLVDRLWLEKQLGVLQLQQRFDERFSKRTDSTSKEEATLRKSFSSTPSTNFNAKIFDNHSRSSSLHLLMVYKKLCKIIFSTSTTSTSDRERLLKIFAFKFVQGVALKDFLKSCFLLQLRVRPL